MQAGVFLAAQILDGLTSMGKPVCLMLIDDDELEHEIAQRALKDKDR
ncbi:MAG: hypothetical protein IID58_13890 [Proteobacteria bacterium]|nr:hypothetical protein [Pseudomonadota bacterium]